NLAWAWAVPIGEVCESRYEWHLDRQDVGLGKPTLVRGHVEYSARGYGVPDGPFRIGSNTWQAGALQTQRLLAGGALHAPIPMTRALVPAVLADFPDAAGPEGFLVDGGVLAKGTVLAALFSLGTSLWWISVREWTWNPTRARSRNLARLALLAVWPFL